MFLGCTLTLLFMCPQLWRYLVLCISGPLNHVRKLLCNLRTLKLHHVNIVVVPPTLDMFILLQHSPLLQIQFKSHWKIDIGRKKCLKSSLLQENTCYWGARKSSVLQASPPFHIKLLPAFISNQPSGWFWWCKWVIYTRMSPREYPPVSSPQIHPLNAILLSIWIFGKAMLMCFVLWAIVFLYLSNTCLWCSGCSSVLWSVGYVVDHLAFVIQAFLLTWIFIYQFFGLDIYVFILSNCCHLCFSISLWFSKFSGISAPNIDGAWI